jgi:hypothetical protein
MHGCEKMVSGGYISAALMRTQEKLLEQLRRSGIQPDTATKILTILVQGDVKHLAAVKRALVIDGQVMNVIICGIATAANHSANHWVLCSPGG